MKTKKKKSNKIYSLFTKSSKAHSLYIKKKFIKFNVFNTMIKDFFLLKKSTRNDIKIFNSPSFIFQRFLLNSF